MIRGRVNCKCKTVFGFETINKKVACPRCGDGYNTVDYEEKVVELIEELEEPEEKTLAFREMTETGICPTCGASEVKKR